MGNRCVITTKDVNKENRAEKLGIYLHWNGSKEDVEAILKKAKERKIRTWNDDYQYFWARLIQIAAEHVEETFGDQVCSIGVDTVECLDCHNWDNGVYYIDENLEICKQTDGSELDDE